MTSTRHGERNASFGIARIFDGRVEGWAYHPYKSEIVVLEADGLEIGRFSASDYLNLSNVPAFAQRAVFKAPIIETVCALESPPNARIYRLRLAFSGAVIAEVPAEDLICSKIEGLNGSGLVNGHLLLSSNSYVVPPSLAIVVDGAERLRFQVDVPHRPRPGFYKADFWLRLPRHLVKGPVVDLALVLEDGEGDVLLARRVFDTPVLVDEASVGTSVSSLIIVDPALSQTKGHMLGVSEKLVRAARSQGVEAIVAAHKRFSLPTIRNARVVRVFSASPYDETAGRGIGGPVRDVDTFWPTFKEGMDDLAEQIDLSGTLIVYPTVNHAMAHALARWLGERSFCSGEHHSIYFMLESGMASGRPGFVTGLLQEALHHLSLHDPAHVTLSAASARLQSDLQELSAAPMRQAPSIVGFDAPQPRRKELPTGVRRLVGLYLGEVKLDKGFHLAPKIIEALDRYKDKFDFFVQVHDLSNKSETASTLHEIERLRDEAGFHITVKRGFLAGDAYEKLMRQLDVLIVAYDPSRYAAKTSGLVWEALSLETPSVVPADSWAADECAIAGLPHATFGRQDPADIAEAVVRLTESLDSNQPAATSVGASGAGTRTAFSFGGDKVLRFLTRCRDDAVSRSIANKVGDEFFEARVSSGVKSIDRETVVLADGAELLDGWKAVERDRFGAKLRSLDAAGVIALYVSRRQPLNVCLRLRFELEDAKAVDPMLELSVNGVPLDYKLSHFNDLWIELTAELPVLENFELTVLRLKNAVSEASTKRVLFEKLSAFSSPNAAGALV